MRWKRFVTVGVLLIISLMVTGYVILANYNYNKFKPRVARIVKEATGRELNLGGEIDFSIGFSPTLTVSDVTFANASWGSHPQMFKIKQVQVQVAVLPLLFKEMKLKYIGFVGVDVFLETDKTGHGNWDFNTKESSAGTTGSFSFHNIDIDKIRIEKLNLTFRDGEREQAKQLNLASLEVAKQGAVDSLALNLKADYNGQQLSLAVKTGLIQLLLAHDHFPFKLAGKFSNTTVKIDGTINDFPSLQGIDLQARVAGTNLAELELGFGPKLPQTNVFDLTGHLKGSKEALALEDITGKLSASAVDLAISGSCGDVIALSGLDLHLKGSGKDLGEIGTLIGSDLPGIGPFDVRGHLIGSPKKLLLNEFSAIVDKSDFKGLAKIEFSKRPKITVQLESSVIDLTPLMTMAEKDTQELGQETNSAGRLFSDDPLPFDALQKVDANFKVKAQNIHMKDAQFELGHLTLTLADSNLNIDNFETTYKQTKITGNLHIDPGSPPQVATNFLVQNFNLGEFFKETGKRDQVRGIVDIAAHGKSSGDSVSSLMAHLNGSFGAVMGPGYLSKYLDLISIDLADKIIPFWGHNKKANEINCTAVQFDIKNGDAVSKAFVNTQIGILSVKGNTNLGTEQVDFLLYPRPKDFSLVNLSTKVRVTGTLMNPKVNLDRRTLSEKAAEEVGGFLTLGPLGLLTPFVHLGAHEKHPCDVQSIGQLEQKISTNE